MRKIALTTTLVVTTLSASAQELLHQPTDQASPVPLSATLRSELDDPFFRIVLEPHPDAIALGSVISLMTEGGLSGFTTFTVGEQIGRPESRLSDAEAQRCGPPSRRVVISFNGFHQPTGKTLDGNAFISTFITPERQVGPLEVVSWDESRGTYNYYKTKDGSWRLRNRSSELATEDEATLSDGCLACHVNGGPIMKEFSFPWNHWHSLSFRVPYLLPGSPASWPVAGNPLFQPRPGEAQELERIVDASLRRFAARLIEEQISVNDDGSVVVAGLHDLIDSLFMPTELNLVSSTAQSGLDEGGLTDLNPSPMMIPDSFFVNAMQMRDIDLPAFLGQSSIVSSFAPGVLGVSLEEYEDLLRTFDIDTECMPGADTVFAWFGTEPSEFDRRMVERLKNRGVIDRDLIAAVLAIDVGERLLSEARASLLRHVPDELRAESEATMAETVRAAIEASLDAVPAADKSDAERDFATLLASDNAFEVLNKRVEALRSDIRQALDLSDPAKRQATLRDLYRRLMDDREAFKTLPISGALAEFPGLFPEPR